MNQENAKSKQIQAIKTRLNDALKAEKMSINQLTDAINDSNSEIKVNYNTVRHAFDHTSDALDLTALIAISRYLHLDTGLLLSPPDTVYKTLKSVTDISSSGQFTILNDDKYKGKYYGYLYSANQKSDTIVHFELENESTPEGFASTLFYHGRISHVDGRVEESSRELYGTPILHTLSSNVFIHFTNDLGDSFYFYFSRQWFRSYTLYFRKGIVLTASSIGEHPPIVQNFVLFARKLSKEKERYLPGLLGTASPSFTIRKDDVDDLRASEPVVADFFKDFDYILSHNTSTVYEINEQQILPSINKHTMDRDTVYQALCLLKEHALEPNRIVYEDNNDLAGFSKTFLQRP
ncbi:MAG: hypothetical protein LUD78_00590 [Clostridiales bacterium]|nr:hypothetical protein [Clostridiales bacterium]